MLKDEKLSCSIINKDSFNGNTINITSCQALVKREI